MDPNFQPAPPVDAYFDSTRSAWVLSRYADVYAALREPRLRQVTDSGEFLPTDDVARHAQFHDEIQADMARMSSAEWRQQMESNASSVIARAAHGKRIDIVSDVIEPWSAAMLLSLSGMDATAATRLTKVAGRMFFSFDQRGDRNLVSSAFNRWRSWRRGRAQAELSRIWAKQKLTLGKSMLTGVTHTLPGFLATSWLALLENPAQAALLLAEPDLMPGAVEELLRYAGIIHSLPRRASSDVQIGNVRIAEGQQVLLRLDSANYDPERFHEPERLDIARRSPGHVGLGIGPHVCVGALLVRMAMATITPVFFAAAPVLEARVPIKWTTDKTLRWPASIPARLPAKEASV
jgi:cytochrome P450